MDFKKVPPSKNFMDRTAMFAELADRARRMGPVLRRDMLPIEHINAMLQAEEAFQLKNDGYPAWDPKEKRPNLRKVRVR